MLLNTATKEYKTNMEAYIFDCINNEDQELNSIQDKIAYALSEFDRVANYPANLHNIPNQTERMADYLQGLPFDFAFSYDEILKDAAKLHNLGSIPKKKEDVIINNWFNHIATHIFKLATKYDIKI